VLKCYERPVSHNLSLLYSLLSPYKGHRLNNGIPLDKALDQILDFSLLSQGFEPYFIEAGAHNGLTSSNTYFLEHNYSFTGMLVEPCLKLYLECVDNRSSKNSFYLSALGEHDNQLINLLYSDSMTVTLSHNCELSADHAITGASLVTGNSSAKLVEFPAYIHRLTTLLDSSSAPNSIFLLSLDTEGMELPILRGIDFVRYLFAYILLETRQLSCIKDTLSIYGYQYMATFGAHDHLFSYIQ